MYSQNCDRIPVSKNKTTVETWPLTPQPQNVMKKDMHIYLYMYIFLEIHKWLPITDTSNLEQWWWPSLPQQALRKGHAGPPMDFSKTLVRHNHRHETWEGAVGYPWLHGNKGDLVPMCLLPT